MVLDIELFRKERGGDPDKIRENAKKRFDSVEAVEEVIRLGKRFVDNLTENCSLSSRLPPNKQTRNGEKLASNWTLSTRQRIRCRKSMVPR